MTNILDFSYCKRKNAELFSSLEKYEITKLQNFLPIYNNYFSLNETNFNNINLNNKFFLKNVFDKINENCYNCAVESNTNGVQKRKAFFKYSPLLDPVKYMIGKYNITDNLFELPSLTNNNCNKKITNLNNSAYVDGFFSFLTSQLLNQQRFVHGTDFYGSFIGIKKNFHYNIFDDIDYLNDSTFFHENMNKLFRIDNEEAESFFCNTKDNQKRLQISDLIDIKQDEMPNFGDLFSNEEKNSETKSKELIFEASNNTSCKKTPKTGNSSSTCSSRSSHTESLDSEDDDASDDSNQSFSDESSNGEDEVLNVILEEFPVNIICLESLDNTLDSLLFGGKILSIPEWKSIFFQILIMLVIYQKVFYFTHNDLHTNNIMYTKTDKKFICYHFNKKYYKVPTFGRLFKIIDFGRAIYKFKDKIICSDSFLKKGDAATQYNFGPCFNKKKPRLEPNFSFDLSRLACSLYDYFVPYSDEERKVKHPIGKLVIKWCRDDNGKNILYKKNGDERYPDFKLYKMIARTVHNHIPAKEIENEIFNDFIVTRKSLKKKRIINVENFTKCYS